MADKLDEYLRQYHTGGLDLLIKQRKEDLRFKYEPDENVGGGRAQNSKTNRVEVEMMMFEEDEVIRELEERKRVIEIALCDFKDKHKEVFNMRYRQRASWATVEATIKVPERTGLRYCTQLKDKIEKHLG